MGIEMNENGIFRIYELIYCGLVVTALSAVGYSCYYIHNYTVGEYTAKLFYDFAMLVIVLIHLHYNCIIALFYLNIYSKFNALNDHFRYEN